MSYYLTENKEFAVNLVKKCVDAQKQANPNFTVSTKNLYDLVDKIGKQISLDGLVEDKLPEFDGEDLPLGKTIEEYFADFILPALLCEGGKGIITVL